jgi:5-amino-6-(5-phosphoribosylamino)uracil reductase
MIDRPYTVLSCSMSLDGYLDDATDRRLVLSNDADLDRVDELRAGCDAILVGAATVRSDDPRLLVRSAERRRQRVVAGLPATPTKVTVTAGGDLDPASRFFTRGSCDKLIYCPTEAVETARDRLASVATVVDSGAKVRMRAIAEDLHARDVGRLMVEGGGGVHTQFLAEGLADELQLTVAPFFVGDSRARRFVGDGRFPWSSEHRAPLVETRPVGDVVLLRYALSDRCDADRVLVGRSEAV